MTMTEISMTPAPSGSLRLLAGFEEYEGAQTLVDRMSDQGFPVEHLRIVGTGIRIVELVTGRLTRGRAALAGAGTGAYFGAFIGLVIGLFSNDSNFLATVLFGIVVGALWGALFGFLAHSASRGRRDFSSMRSLQADKYEVHVDAAYADQAGRFVL